MISDSLLRGVSLVESILLASGWLFLMLHGWYSQWARARRGIVRRGWELLSDAALARSISDEARAEIAALRPSEQRALFRRATANLAGPERKWLTGLATDLGLAEQGIVLCGSHFWWRRLAGARLLTFAGGGGNRVLELAADPHPLVRAQVAEWCGANPSAAAVRTLVGMLGDPDLTSRFAVQDALVRLAEWMTKPLARALAAELGRVEDEKQALAALVVAYAVGDRRLAPPLAQLADHESPAVRAAAYRALGSAGGAQVDVRLERGLSDGAPVARAAAAMGMGELGHWQGARLVVRQLSDRSWDVRYAAGRALLLMGPPGELLLRRALKDENPFARDMARHTLDVAAVVDGLA